jgi:transposase
MMGVQAASAQLFYDFCLDDHVPSDHMLRGIERHLELDDLRQSLKPFYSQIGRPSVDPELMIRMLIVGYRMGIRSERRLCEEVHLNLAYRWFCRLGLGGRFLITRHSRRTDTGAFARATRCAGFSRAWCNVASSRAWSAPTDLRSTPA